ncbi:MAG: hypothetical protein COB15_06630 [Flavobacteriales bacterium]|nr:MAG: hypothetical protein COB15_06630 [Flavobacteriales bacterium]
MLDQELKNIWKNATQQELVKFEMSKLLMEMNQKLKKFDKSIKTRDSLEIIAAFIVISVMIYYAIIIPYVLTKIASLLIIPWALFVVYKLRNVKKHKPANLDLSFRNYLVQQRSYLKRQMILLDNILYWYILPPFVIAILFFMGLPLTTMMWITKMGFVLLVSIGVLYLNKRAVKKQFKPLIKQLDETISNLED